MKSININLDFLHNDGITSFSSEYNSGKFLNYLILAKDYENKLRNNKGLENSLNTVHHLPLYNSQFLNLCFKSDILQFCSKYFKGEFILHSCNACLTNKPTFKSYVNDFHRDTTCYFRNENLFLNIFIPLTDFDSEDGPLLYIPGSHLNPDRPSENSFKNESTPLLTSKGKITVWHSCLWHRLGDKSNNKTSGCITIIYCKPFIKPQLDYSKYFQKDFDNFSIKERKILGFYSQPATSLENFHVENKERSFRKLYL